LRGKPLFLHHLLNHPYPRQNQQSSPSGRLRYPGQEAGSDSLYHQIRDWKPTDSKISRTYIVPPAAFAAQMRMLADSGYHTISPDQLYSYLISGTRLPAKPILLSFDDTDLDQYTVAFPEMKKYGFKGIFFIMTVSLGRPHYMSRTRFVIF